MGFIVKNTTKISVLDLICPHKCKNCGKIGEILCERCKKYLLDNYENHCPNCKKIVYNICDECNLSFDGLWVFGWRDELIGKIVKDYKFKSCRALSSYLAEIYDYMLPYFAEEVIIIPVPTASKHIRERGFDHTLLLAKKLASRRGWSVSTVLKRAKSTVQVGKNSEERLRQAKNAFYIANQLSPDKIYLLIDDIWTTGASMKSAADLLYKNGAKTIIGAVLATSKPK